MKKLVLICSLLVLVSGGIAYAAMISESVAKSGCCSRHGGVSYCGKSGYYVCADGTTSPSCRCR